MPQPHSAVMDRFQEISRIPRCSKNEKAIRDWVLQWASGAGFRHRQDAAGNAVVVVPAAPGCESGPPVVLQCHMDMVCEKTPDCTHDFSRDPLRLVYAGEWVRADRTTLGADNGIGMALAVAAAEDPSLRRPPLELLFTVDEETGLTGADRLDPELIEGGILLNLDSEDEGVFTIGCAGGEELEIDLALERSAAPARARRVGLTVGGLRGGHSGIDIVEQRECANRLMARLLDAALVVEGVGLDSVDGGSAHNAIARDAAALLWSSEGSMADLRAAVSRLGDLMAAESRAFEPRLEIRLQERNHAEAGGEVLTPTSAERLLRLLQTLPHGVYRMSAGVEGLVETSSNLAVVKTQGNAVRITTSQRSALESRIDELGGRIRSAAALAGARVRSVNRYPAWQPDPDADLLATCRRVYRGLYGVEPTVEVIHAGLECGIIGAKKPGMQMISFGPTIRNPHSPDEALHLPSVEKTYRYLAALLEALDSGGDGGR